MYEDFNEGSMWLDRAARWVAASDRNTAIGVAGSLLSFAAVSMSVVALIGLWS